MIIRDLLVCILILAAVSAQSLVDPKLVRISKLKRAINSFGFNLFIDFAMFQGDSNFVISPYSLSNALGILHFVSVGEAEKELADALEYKAVNLTKDEVAHTFNLFLTQLLPSSKPKFYIFNVSSSIVVNRSNRVIPKFQSRVEYLFQVPISFVDFSEWGEVLARSANDWLADTTKDEVRNLINYVDAASRMMILNTAFFKGVWRHKFPPADSKLGVFYNEGLTWKATEVHMMKMKKMLFFHQDKDLSVVELPFKGRNVSMIILLPQKLDGFNGLLFVISPEFLEDKISRMSRSMRHVVLPNFKVDFAADMNMNLHALGIQNLFHPYDKIYHKLLLSVTENGVEVGAVTATEKLQPETSMLETTDFLADHPFMFIIYERKMHMVLFMGHVVKL